MTEPNPTDTEIDDLQTITALIGKHDWHTQQRMLNWLWERFFTDERKRRANELGGGSP